jgi:transcriptional regulator with XRE-family HTH domain
MKLNKPKAQKIKSAAAASFRSAFAKRLKHAAERHDIGQLAAQLGVRPVTLYRWLSATFDPSLPKLAELAEATQVSLAWLVAGTGPVDSRRAARHARLAEYDLVDFDGDDEIQKAPLAFHQPWLFQLFYGPSQSPTLFGAVDMTPPLLIEVRDDSMEPTIVQGDLLLVDRSFGVQPTEICRVQIEGRSFYDGIYAFRAGSAQELKAATGQAVVRRVQYQLDGTLAIRCDNPKYPPELYPAKAHNWPRPLGRIIWRGGRI